MGDPISTGQRPFFFSLASLLPVVHDEPYGGWRVRELFRHFALLVSFSLPRRVGLPSVVRFAPRLEVGGGGGGGAECLIFGFPHERYAAALTREINKKYEEKIKERE